MENFDEKLTGLLEEMAEVAFDYVNFNMEEIDTIYIIGLIESGYFYKQFYKVNNNLVKSHKLNSFSKLQYDLSNSRAFEYLNRGNEILKMIEQLFKNDNRQIPNSLKLEYFPKTKKLEFKIGYEKTFTNHLSKTAQDVYEEWFNELN